MSGTGGLTKKSTGVAVLTGANTFSGGVTIMGGTLNINADAALGDAANGVMFTNTTSAGIAATATPITLGAGRTIAIQTNSVLLTVNGVFSMTVAGPITGVANAGGTGSIIDKRGTGTLILTGGSGGTVHQRIRTTGTGTAGKISIQGGVWNVATNIAGEATPFIAATGAIFEQTAGTVNSASLTSLNETNIFSGGTFNVIPATGILILGRNTGGTTTISGGALVDAGSTLSLGETAATTTTLNLNGGAIACNNVTSRGTVSGHTQILNFNGGTLRAKASSNPFITSLTAAYVKSGGAIIDSAGFGDQIPQPLLHDPGLGAALDGGLTKTGANWVRLSGVNTYNGGTTIKEGALSTLFISDDNNLGAASGGVNFAKSDSGAQAAEFLAAWAGSSPTLGAGRTITIASNTWGYFQANLGDTMTVNGPITGIANEGVTGSILAKHGFGTVILTGGSGGSVLQRIRVNQGTLSIQGGVWDVATNYNAGDMNPLMVYPLATYEQTGGTVNLPSLVTFGATASEWAATGLFSGGTLRAEPNGEFMLGRFCSADMTVSGSALMDLDQLKLGEAAGLTNITTLNLGNGGAGGTIACTLVGTRGTPADHISILNFDGGTLRAKTNQSSFITDLTEANVKSGAIIDSQGFTVLIPQALLHDPGYGSSPDGGLTKKGAGVVALSGVNTYTGGTTVDEGTLGVIGTLGSGAVAVKSGANLGGSGTIGGAVTVEAGGTLQPGLGGTDSSPLTINNTLGLAGTTIIAINRTNASNASTLTGISTLTPGGTLTVTNVGSPLQANDSFTLFSASSGTYSGPITLPDLGAGLVWTNRLAVNGTIAVYATVSTTPTNIAAVVNGGNLELSWPADHLGWTAQSNSVSVANPSFWFDIAGSATTNFLSLPMEPAATNVFFRLYYPLP